MLEPDQRRLLLEALRPPAGYTLDTAVGATYSLDLDALLIVPLAFALFDVGEEEQPDPIGLLAAVREYAEKITLFSQAGAVNVPREYRRLAAYLEDCVMPVTAPRPGHIFHPKTWLLRYVDEAGEPLLRCLVASRNLTFSRSWDTIVVLDEAAGKEPNGAGLAELFRALPAMATAQLSAGRRQTLESLAAAAAEASFAPPEPFASVAFHPLGLPGRRDIAAPLDGRADRWLVLSPFLTADALGRLGKAGTRSVLVSRAESLARVGAANLKGFDELYVLSDRAFGDEASGEAAAFADEATAERPEADLRGLHAKVYIADAGWNARVISGSANATGAAWGGNVELVLEMVGPKSQVGIQAFMGHPANGTSFQDLLEPFAAPIEPEPPSLRDELMRDLDVAQRELASAGGTTTVLPAGDDFDLRVDLPGPVSTTCTAAIWPISLRGGRAQALIDGGATFQGLSFTAITSFVAVELEARREGLVERVRFVIPTRLVGAPSDRLERLLTEELSSPADVLRYLLLLLAVDEAALGMELSLGAGGSGDWQIGDVALFEAMLRVITRDRGRLAAVDRLVADLQRTTKGTAAIPPGLLEIWLPMREALSDG